MNKSESKYYNTALLMNSALVEILNKKEYEYITVKEICEKAGVNRSTFYLHYETIDDLLNETIENQNKQFFSYFNESGKDFVAKINSCPKQDLILITPEYLTPYLKYIKENKTIHQVAVKHQYVMNSNKKFDALFVYIFKPIFKRLGVEEEKGRYIIAFYINGISAIVNEWIKNGCKEDISFIENVIIECIRPYC